MTTPIRVLCVDDNPLVAAALQRRLDFEPGFEWAGWVQESADVIQSVRRHLPMVLLLDIDMPGRDCFDLLRELVGACPGVKVLIFSGHVRADYFDQALDSGAWGYLSKNSSIEDVLAAIRQVASGEFFVSPEIEQALGA